MKDTVLILGVFVVMIFWLKSDSDKRVMLNTQSNAATNTTSQSSTGGKTQEAPQDTFDSIMQTISSVADAVGKVVSGSGNRN